MNELPPRKLYERLREVTGASSDEDLARAIGEGVKTVTRLKSGHGVEFDRTIKLLDLAGWLRLNGEAEPLEESRLRFLANRIQQAADELAAFRGERQQSPPD
jgi:hypothetical protein